MCLYCREDTGGFTSAEHILPQTLGNETGLLPKGVVCDRCNHGILSRLDRTFLDFAPIKFTRALYGTPNKRGKITDAQFTNGNVTRDDNGELRIVASEAYDVHHVTKSEDTVEFSMSLIDKQVLDKNYVKLLTRAVFKFALGYIYFYNGEQVGMSKRYDEARDIILGKRSFHGFLEYKATTLHEVVSFICDIGKQSSIGSSLTVIQCNVHGLVVVTEMEQRQIETMPIRINGTVHTF